MPDSMMIVAAAAASVLATGAMDVQHYRLDLRVDPASKSLHGVVDWILKHVTYGASPGGSL